MLPLRGKQAEFSATLESKRMEIDAALEYVELYGLYTECEAIYQVDNLLALWDSLEPPTRPRSRSTHASSTGCTTSTTSTCRRSSSTPASRRRPASRASPDRMERLRKQVLDPKRHVVAFDLENTLIASNVVESYSFLATRRLNGPSGCATCCAP
jgi:alcohol-forming fatty acyl-CoA reductase